MRKSLVCFGLCLMLLGMALCACAAGYEGVYSGRTENGLLVLELKMDGTGEMEDGSGRQAVTYSTEGDGALYAGEEKLGSLTARDGFLILTDLKGEAWPMMKNETILPGTVQAQGLSDFEGRWEADFALVSSFRIPLKDVRMTMEVDGTDASFSGTGYETPAVLPCRVEDGALCVPCGEETWVFTMLEDRSLVRVTQAMTIHYAREGTAR